jgi:hypothetical protein
VALLIVRQQKTNLVCIPFANQEQGSILDFGRIHPAHVFDAPLEVVRSSRARVAARHCKYELAKVGQVFLLEEEHLLGLVVQ